MISSKFAYSCPILLCNFSNLLNKNISRHLINYGIFSHALVVTVIMPHFVFSWWTKKLAALPTSQRGRSCMFAAINYYVGVREAPIWEMRLMTLLMLLSCCLTILMACTWYAGFPNLYFCAIVIHKGEINQFPMIPYSGGVHNYIIHCWDGKKPD